MGRKEKAKMRRFGPPAGGKSGKNPLICASNQTIPRTAPRVARSISKIRSWMRKHLAMRQGGGFLSEAGNGQ
jgi:hypothetical protein